MNYKKNLLFFILFLGIAIASNAQSMEDFPWLNDVIDQENCCFNQTVTLYNYGEIPFIFVANNSDCAEGGKLYSEDGTCWCTDDGGIDCLGFYSTCIAAGPTGCTAYEGLDRLNGTVLYECGAGEELTVYNRFAWLEEVADPSDCCNNKTIEVYEQQGAFFDSGNSIYVHVLSDPSCGEGIGTLYAEDGFQLCVDTPGFSCLDAYGIESREKISELTCN